MESIRHAKFLADKIEKIEVKQAFAKLQDHAVFMVNQELTHESRKHSLVKLLMVRKGMVKFERLNNLKRGFEKFKDLMEFPDLNFTNLSQEERERSLENMESLRRFYLARDAFSMWKDRIRESPTSILRRYPSDS